MAFLDGIFDGRRISGSIRLLKLEINEIGDEGIKVN
jgi:hypothetical protein